MSFKNQIKILENNLTYIKESYYKDSQILINKEILITKQINQLQINKLSEFQDYDIKKIIKFDRDEFNEFTIIKINYVQPE